MSGPGGFSRVRSWAMRCSKQMLRFGRKPLWTFSPAVSADTLATWIASAKGCAVPDGTTAAKPDEPDYDRLLRANLERVFNERDSAKREHALDELFVADPVMYEPTDVVRGREAISAVAGKLLDQFGPSFRFVPDGVAAGHHGFGVLRWHAGPQDGPVAVTGSDVAEVVEGRIMRLWVMLDPPTT